MQARRRRGDCTGNLRIDSLITLRVFSVRRVLDVGRKRHRAEALEHGVDVYGKAHAIELAFATVDSYPQILHDELGTRRRRVARLDQRERFARTERTLDEELDLAAARLAPDETRFHHA